MAMLVVLGLAYVMHVRAIKAELTAVTIERDQARSANKNAAMAIDGMTARHAAQVKRWVDEAEAQRTLAEERAGIIRDLESRKLIPVTASQVCRIGEGTDDPLAKALRSLNPRRPD